MGKTLAKFMYEDYDALDIKPKAFPHRLNIAGQEAKVIELGYNDQGEETWVRYATSAKPWGFMQGLDISQVYPPGKPEITLWRVQHLSGNCWGIGSWLIIRTEFFHRKEDALDNVRGVRSYKPPRKRKLIPPPPIDEEELRKIFDVRAWQTTVQTRDGMAHPKHYVWAMNEEQAKERALETYSGATAVLQASPLTETELVNVEERDIY